MTTPDSRPRLEQKLTAAGAEILPFAVARHGVFRSARSNRKLRQGSSA